MLGITRVVEMDSNVLEGRNSFVIVIGETEAPASISHVLKRLRRRLSWINAIVIAGDNADPLLMGEGLRELLVNIGLLPTDNTDLVISLGTYGLDCELLEELIESHFIDCVQLMQTEEEMDLSEEEQEQVIGTRNLLDKIERLTSSSSDVE